MIGATYGQRDSAPARIWSKKPERNFRSGLAGLKAQNAPLKIRIAFCNSDPSSVNASGALASLRVPGQEHFTYPYCLGASYTEGILRGRSGIRRGKLWRHEIEIYYSFVGKVELPES